MMKMKIGYWIDIEEDGWLWLKFFVWSHMQCTWVMYTAINTLLIGLQHLW
jgi:hypothetical protein